MTIRPTTRTGTPGQRVRIALTAILVFVLASLGLFSLRTAISSDLFGGDVVNIAAARDSSYALWQGVTVADIADLAKWLRQGRSETASPAGFAYSQLSLEARDAIDDTLAHPDDIIRRARLTHHLNLSLIDRPIAWPKDFSGPPKIAGYWTDGDTLEDRNMRALAAVYPIALPLRPVLRPLHDDLLGTVCTGAFWHSLFSLGDASRFAPLTAAWSIVWYAIQAWNTNGFGIAVAATSVVFGTLVASVFLLSWLHFRTVIWSVLAAGLTATSMAVLLASHSLFALPYLLVPMVVTVGLSCYVAFRGSGTWWGFAGFALCAMLGPWLREFAGILPFVAFFDTILFRKGDRRRPLVILTCLILMAHSVYPSALPWLLGINEGIVISIFQQGNTQAQLSEPSGRFFGILLGQAPPVLWLLAIGGIAHSLARAGLPASGWERLDRLSARLPPRKAAWVFLVSAAIFLVGILGVGHLAKAWYGLAFRPGLVVLMAMTLFPLLLGLWSAGALSAPISLCFSALFLPFLLMSLSEVHFSFVVPTLMIMLTAALREAWRASARGPRWRAVYLAFMAVGLGDQALNIPAVITVQSRLVDLNHHLADWLTAHAPRHSIMIANFYGYADIYRNSNYWVDAFESVENNPFGPNHTIFDDSSMQTLLRTSAGLRDIYLIEAKHDFYSWQRGHHSHKWVLQPPVALDIAAQFPVRIAYLYLDPLKALVPRRSTSFPGYMDWDTDFYTGPGARPFHREVRADFTIYRMRTETWDSAVEPLSPRGFAAISGNGDPAEVTFRDLDAFWEAKAPPPWQLQAIFDQPTLLVAYGLSAGPKIHRAAGNRQMPRAWIVEGSNDGVSWREVDRRRDDRDWAHREWRRYNVATPGRWQRYRLSVTESGSPDIVRLYDWSLVGKASPPP